VLAVREVNYPQFFRNVSPDSNVLKQLVRTVLWFGFTRAHIVFFDAAFQAGQARDFENGAADLGLEIVSARKLTNSGSGGAAVSAENRPAMEQARSALPLLLSA